MTNKAPFSDSELLEMAHKYDDLLLDVLQNNEIHHLEYAALVLGRIASISMQLDEVDEFEMLLNHALVGLAKMKDTKTNNVVH